jgi:hypothetical protein
VSRRRRIGPRSGVGGWRIVIKVGELDSEHIRSESNISREAVCLDLYMVPARDLEILFSHDAGFTVANMLSIEYRTPMDCKTCSMQIGK